MANYVCMYVLSFSNKKLHYNRAGQQFFFYAPCNRMTSSLQKRNHHLSCSHAMKNFYVLKKNQPWIIHFFFFFFFFFFVINFPKTQLKLNQINKKKLYYWEKHFTGPFELCFIVFYLIFHVIKFKTNCTYIFFFYY